MPYLLINSFKPFLPIPVCFAPRIAISVPIGNETLVSGTKVTFVWSPKDLVKVIPCLALLPIVQPSFRRRLISFLPESSEAMRTLMNQLRDRLDMRTIEGFSSYWSMNCKLYWWFCAVILDRVLFKEARSLVHIFKCIQVKHNSLFKFSFGLWDRTSKRSCAEFITTGYPSSTLFSKLKGNGNITGSSHEPPPFRGCVVFNIPDYIILPFVKASMQKISPKMGGFATASELIEAR